MGRCLWSLMLWAVWMAQGGAAGAAGASPWAAEIGRGGRILMIRHAHAPGSGDPDHFTIGDCRTQRNLNDEGRRQARRIGAWFREQGIDSVRLFSSQWCRCLETARLLGFGEPEELKALNSFFQRPRDREPNLKALRDFHRLMSSSPAARYM